jgi:hypothetical protein
MHFDFFLLLFLKYIIFYNNKYLLSIIIIFYYYNCFLKGCVNLSFSFVEGESLLMALKEIALSSGYYYYIARKISFVNY